MGLEGLLGVKVCLDQKKTESPNGPPAFIPHVPSVSKEFRSIEF